MRGAQEDVYLQSAALQDELSELFRALDKGKGTETGCIPKVRLHSAPDLPRSPAPCAWMHRSIDVPSCSRFGSSRSLLPTPPARVVEHKKTILLHTGHHAP